MKRFNGVSWDGCDSILRLQETECCGWKGGTISKAFIVCRRFLFSSSLFFILVVQRHTVKVNHNPVLVGCYLIGRSVSSSHGLLKNDSEKRVTHKFTHTHLHTLAHVMQSCCVSVALIVDALRSIFVCDPFRIGIFIVLSLHITIDQIKEQKEWGEKK